MSKKAYAEAPLRASQNFLTRGQTVERLLRGSGIGSGDHVVEIGPGKGHITRALLLRGARVTAVELDAALCLQLNERFGDSANLRLVRGDFLAWKLPRTPYKVFANIPFALTSRIVKRLCEAENPPGEAFLIVEEGAARALCGKPRECARSLMLKPFFELRVAARVPRTEFHPMPSVDAALLHLRRKPVPDVPRGQSAAYRAMIERCFRAGFAGVFTRNQQAAAFRRAGIAPGATPGDILYTQWLCLFRSMQAFGMRFS